MKFANNQMRLNININNQSNLAKIKNMIQKMKLKI